MDESMETYTPWLIRRSEREFFRMILSYVDDISDEINILGKEVECLISNDYNACLISMEFLSKKSKNAIKVRKQLVRKLEDANITPDHRGYIANLIYSISDIAGYIDSASARLSLRHVKIKDNLRAGIGELMEKTSHMIMLLRDSIDLLDKDLDKCLERADQVNNLEEDIDEIRRALLKIVVNDPDISDPADLHVLVEILGSLETVSDKIDAAANRVEVIAMTHLP